MKTTRNTSTKAISIELTLIFVATMFLWPGISMAIGPLCDPDHDGSLSMQWGCGGDDCDDTDGNRYPGNIEVCDSQAHDEDCDSSTFGSTDTDGDGFVSAQCCNGSVCGRDCDDSRPGTHPNQNEVCNGRDDNCDTAVDEGVNMLAFLDTDNDGWGSGSGQLFCPQDIGAGWAVKPGDCNNNAPSIHPGATEVCNGLDNNCNGMQDDGLAGFGVCD